MENMELFWSNPVARAAVYGWVIAQVLKVIINILVHKEFKMERFVGSGGMPSSHTAFVMAVLSAIARVEGIHSTIFVLSFAMALIVMYDAMGVRRAAGKQAQLINQMIENWHTDDNEMFGNKLKELIGHTPLEVIAGAILGIIVGLSVVVN